MSEIRRSCHPFPTPT